MLKDIERKVLRVLWNFQSGRKRMPMLGELSVKTGRPERELLFILKKLEEQKFLEWDGRQTVTIQIVKGWEDQAGAPGTPAAISIIKSNSDYTRFLD